MTNSYIAVLDSGAGGLSLLKKLTETFPSEKFLYFGDLKNAPYGNKSVAQLKKITELNIDKIKQFPIKAIVLGCNTLSVTLRSDIENYAAVPVIGVYPPVEMFLSQNKKVLMLSTVRTSEKFLGYKGLDVVGLKTLARDIEYNMFNLQAVDLERNLKNSFGKYTDKKGYYDVIILGCTHYIFVKNKILDHFCPKKIISGEEFSVKQLKKLLPIPKKQVKHCKNQVLFLGEFAKYYKKIYVNGGQK